MHCACAVLYCHPWNVGLCHILPHYLKNGTILGNKVTEYEKCALTSSTTFICKIPYSKKDRARYYRCTCRTSSCKVRVHYRQIWIKLEICGKILEKYPNIKLKLKFVQWEPRCSILAEGRTDGQTDRRTDMTKPIVDFRNFANAPENSSDVLPSSATIGKMNVVFRRRA